MIQVHTWLYMLGCWIMCDKSSAWSFCTCGTRKEMITHDNSVTVGLRYCRFQTGLKRTKRVATGDRILCCVTSWSWTMREKVFLLHPVGRSGLELQDHARPVVYSIPNPHRNHAVVQTLKVYSIKAYIRYWKWFPRGISPYSNTRVHFEITDKHARV